MSAIRRETTGDLSYLRRDGQGTPLVLLHGIGSNAQSFFPLMSALSADVAAIAWDAPGYSASRPLAAEWPSASDYAGALARLLDALGIARCVLLGHSLGTLMASRFAAQWPQRVDQLILISPTLGYSAPHGGPMPLKVAARLADLDRLGAARFAEERASGLVAEPAARFEVVEAVRVAMADVRRPGYDQAVRMLASGRLADDLARLHAPVTVIVGTLDRITPPDVAKQAFAALDNADRRHTYREVAGAAHAVCQEEPRAVARLIDEALQKKAIAHA